MQFKYNEKQFEESLEANKQTIQQQVENYRKLKEHASDKLEK